MLNFNRGWLYEWFNAYIQDEESYLELQTSLKAGGNTPLKKMMNASASKRERIEGRKGGDFIEKGGRQIQAKMENQKILTKKKI